MPGPYTAFTYGSPMPVGAKITLPLGGGSSVAPVVIESLTLKSGVVGTAYSATVGAVGGTGAKTFAVTSGSLPTGTTLNASTGVISGTPTVAGTYSPSIQATDSLSVLSVSVVQAIVIAAAPSSVLVSSPGFPGGMVGIAYSATVGASGGTSPYTFAVTSGALPGGTTLNTSTGVISGTPTTQGNYTFTIQATDSLSNATSTPFSISIFAASTGGGNSGFIS